MEDYYDDGDDGLDRDGNSLGPQCVECGMFFDYAEAHCQISDMGEIYTCPHCGCTDAEGTAEGWGED